MRRVPLVPRTASGSPDAVPLASKVKRTRGPFATSRRSRSARGDHRRRAAARRGRARRSRRAPSFGSSTTRTEVPRIHRRASRVRAAGRRAPATCARRQCCCCVPVPPPRARRSRRSWRASRARAASPRACDLSGAGCSRGGARGETWNLTSSSRCRRPHPRHPAQPIRARRQQVVAGATGRAGGAIHVRVAPWIERHRLAQVWPAPVQSAAARRRLLPQRGEPLLRRSDSGRCRAGRRRAPRRASRSARARWSPSRCRRGGRCSARRAWRARRAPRSRRAAR